MDYFDLIEELEKKYFGDDSSTNIENNPMAYNLIPLLWPWLPFFLYISGLKFYLDN